MTPKILFVDHTGSLGGAELYLLDLARAYPERCSVLLFEDGPFRKRLEGEDIDCDVIPASSPFTDVRKESTLLSAFRAVPEIASLAFRVARRARAHDLIFANSQKALTVAGPASWWSRRPLIWNLHDLLVPEHFGLLNRWVATRWANWFADRVVVNSEATRDAFTEQGGDRTKTGLVYNGIASAPFENVPESPPEDIRLELSIPEGVPLVGVFSRIAEWKGQDVMIRALSRLPNTHLLLVGDALFDTDESYKKELVSLCDQQGVSDRVHFLGFRDDVPRLMKTVDVVVHTSTAPEPFGRVIVEAMLAGTPVVASRAGGPTEIIDDGRTGLLVPPGDPSALTQSIRELLRSEKTIDTLTSQARAEAKTRFSRGAMLDAVENQIHQVVQR